MIKQKTPFINLMGVVDSTEDHDSKKEEELASELASNTKDLMWINMLSSTIKEALYRTIMGAICYYYPRIIEKYTMSNIFKNQEKNSQDLIVF